MKVCVTGGSGMIGRHLVAALLERGDAVTVFTRAPTKARAVLGSKGAAPDVFAADTTAEGRWQETVRESDAVVNLAGENLLAHRWTDRVKETLADSRYLTTMHVAEAIATSGRSIALVSASAVGYYGPRDDDRALDESAAPGHDFLAHLCVDWEHSCAAALDAGSRVVNPRIGVVLDMAGGALPRMVAPFRVFAGGWVGSGEQWVSWIHVKDLVRILVAAVDDPRLSGPVNACSPRPARMRDFAAAIGHVLGRRAWLHVPDALLRVALGELADVLLTGQRVVPAKLAALGFDFSFPELEPALADLLGVAPEALAPKPVAA
jgi:uncharacterized protein (TIGR01777 family)